MSSLAILNPLPDPRETIASLRREVEQAERRAEYAEQEAAEERRKRVSLEKGVAALRITLRPLHEGLLIIFGEMEAMGVDMPTSAPAAKSSAAWDSWKNRLGGVSARIIDILMLHGELNQEQIRIHVGTNRKQTIYDAISKLNKAGIINKRDGRISLKEL